MALKTWRYLAHPLLPPVLRQRVMLAIQLINGRMKGAHIRAVNELFTGSRDGLLAIDETKGRRSCDGRCQTASLPCHGGMK